MFKFILLIASALTVGSAAANNAQGILFDIPKLDLAKLGWGRHTFPVKIINKSEYLKYVAVVTSVKCDGLRLSPVRKVTKNYAVFPDDTVKAEGVLLVPGNYGEIKYEIKLYDVVDTVDRLLESQVFEKQSGSVSFPATAVMAPFLRTEMTLPPLVGLHIDFDNDFSQVLPFLVSDDKSVIEIAKMAGCDTSFVIEELEYMVSRGYYQKIGGQYLTNIAAIKQDEAAKEAQLARKVAESVAAKLAENYKTYRNVIDSLVKDSLLTADSNSFMDGGAILYKPYPVVTTLSLWYDIGSSFVSTGSPLYLYDGTDLCNTYLPSYMYITAGPKENNGHQLFAFMRNYRSYQFYFGDSIPRIVCPEGFMFSPENGINVVWEYEQPYYPEGFIVDTAQVRPMLNHLRRGMEPILKDALEQLSAIGQKHDKTLIRLGQRYWFWNIVATRVVEILTSQGVLNRRGNGQYRLDGMSVK